MLRLFRRNGKLKVPVVAYRSFGDEFLIYVTDFSPVKWEDIYAQRLCIINCRPHKGFKESLQKELESIGFQHHIIVEASV